MSRASQYARMMGFGGTSFGRVTAPPPARRNRPSVRPDIRFYQERVPHLKNMDRVIGTTSAPSDQHVLAGFQNGYAVWEKRAAPTPPPAPAPAPAGPSPQQQMQIASLTKESEAYRAQAEKTIAEGQARVAELENEELQRQKATELQNRLAIQSAASKARGQAQASLKIAPAGQTPQTAGTQAFKRRRDRMSIAPIQSTAGINVPSGNILNI